MLSLFSELWLKKTSFLNTAAHTQPLFAARILLINHLIIRNSSLPERQRNKACTAGSCLTEEAFEATQQRGKISFIDGPIDSKDSRVQDPFVYVV